MIKALFCDFYGTLVHENGPISYEVIRRIYKGGNARSPEEAVSYWWESISRRLQDACGPNYRTQYDLALENFEDTLAHFQCRENAREMCDLMVQHWCQPPIYEDTRGFLAAVRLPVHFVTNSDDLFVEKATAYYNLQPAGIFTSEGARHAKPRPEIFLYALEQTGLKPEEVLHLGDSLTGDVFCPSGLGIRAIWLNRDGQPVPEGIEAVSTLAAAAALIQQIQLSR